MTDTLKERLLAEVVRNTVVEPPAGYEYASIVRPHLVNPDGPEAHAEIERLEREVERLRSLMRKWVEMIDAPDVQNCGLASSLLFGIQRAARAVLTGGSDHG